MRIFGVILAGGAGRRMGGADKAALILGGQKLIDICAARLEPQVEQMAISANGDMGRFSGPWPVLRDTQPLGPLSGILAALDWGATNGADYIASVAVDTPHFPCDLVARLRLAQAETAGAAIALAHGTRVHGTFGLWPIRLRGDLAAFLSSGANPRVLDFAAGYPLAYARFADEAAFDNINAPQDLARLQAGLRGQI
ncbi:MAG: molybdenum cofactor guanylyltransferase MobA [Cypionkella sp.]|nr:molybdenum cofactor guanylyltransferase MobA [Cypionkella sp.]